MDRKRLPIPPRWALPAVLIAFAACTFFLTPYVAKLTFFDYVNDRAMATVDETLAQDQKTFLVISAIKAGMALIEGSTVGVGFELEVGDVIQPAYDYVDFFWRVFLYAFLIMGFYKVLLETGLLDLGIVAMGVGALMWSVALMYDKQRQRLGDAGTRLILFGFLLAYIVPVSLLSTELLSAHYTDQLKAKHYREIQAFNSQLQVAQNDFVNLREKISVFRPGESFDEIRTQLLSLAESVAESFRLSFTAFLFYVLLVLFDLLFFPFLSAYLLYKCAALTAKGLFDWKPRPQPAPAQT